MDAIKEHFDVPDLEGTEEEETDPLAEEEDLINLAQYKEYIQLQNLRLDQDHSEWTESDIINEMQLQNLFLDDLNKWLTNKAKVLKDTSKKWTKNVVNYLGDAHDSYLDWHDKARGKIVQATVGGVNFVGDKKRIAAMGKTAADVGSMVRKTLKGEVPDLAVIKGYTNDVINHYNDFDVDTSLKDH